ncbi:hypothetical protein FKM82_001837 [Ascaphus truei]
MKSLKTVIKHPHSNGFCLGSGMGDLPRYIPFTQCIWVQCTEHMEGNCMWSEGPLLKSKNRKTWKNISLSG